MMWIIDSICYAYWFLLKVSLFIFNNTYAPNDKIRIGNWSQKAQDAERRCVSNSIYEWMHFNWKRGMSYTRSFYLHVSDFIFFFLWFVIILWWELNVNNWVYLLLYLCCYSHLFSNRQMFIMLQKPMVENLQLKYTKHLFWHLSEYYEY